LLQPGPLGSPSNRPNWLTLADRPGQSGPRPHDSGLGTTANRVPNVVTAVALEGLPDRAADRQQNGQTAGLRVGRLALDAVRAEEETRQGFARAMLSVSCVRRVSDRMTSWPSGPYDSG
jgi:hypothetical protein